MSVQDGMRQYRRSKTPPDDTATQQADLAAQPGTVAYGRLLWRARCGDDQSREAVAARGRPSDPDNQVADLDGQAGVTLAPTPAA